MEDPIKLQVGGMGMKEKGSGKKAMERIMNGQDLKEGCLGIEEWYVVVVVWNVVRMERLDVWDVCGWRKLDERWIAYSSCFVFSLEIQDASDGILPMPLVITNLLLGI